MTDLLRKQTVAVTNLESAFVRAAPDEDPAAVPSPWPAASYREVAALGRNGINLVSCANNRALDHGQRGLASTQATLRRAGIGYAGCGDDLTRARQPAYVGPEARRVALISVATSAAPETRATDARGPIQARAGVNTLRYRAEVIADPTTFEVLKRTGASPSAGGAELEFRGVRVRRGAKTGVVFVVNEQDQASILAAIRAARSHAKVVVVALHSHEPDNAAVEPSSFVRSFAEAAVDAGAQVIMGHGPHQLRGVQIYRGGVIFYSLGDFHYQRRAVAGKPADVYDAGFNLEELALGALGPLDRPKWGSLDAPQWSQSVVAVATFDGSILRSVRLTPLDLGLSAAPEARGVPRLVGVDQGRAIIRRLASLSLPYGTAIVERDGHGELVLTSRTAQ